jgi:NitT/TauT family transport system substrate-binding protein
MSIGVWQQMPDHTGLHILVGVADYGDAAPVVNKVNVVTAEVLENRRADVEAVVRALTKLSRDVNNNPQMWVDAMVTARPDVDRATLEALAEAFKNSWSVNGGMSKAELEFSVGEIYKSEDFAGVPQVELADWVDFSVVDSVLEDLGVDEAADEPTR